MSEREIHAYHDGELSWWGRRRVERRLARDPAARRELAELRGLRGLLREQAEGVPAPDLWNGIRAELAPIAPAAPGREGEERATGARLGAGWLRWAAPALAAAAVALALTFGLEWGDAPDARSLRWLDTGGRPAVVLQDDREATIIWVLDAPGQVSGRTARAFI